MKKYIAHAGIHLGSTLATQNSLRSIEYAAAAGFDYVELDVRMTADGVPVVLHDRELNATYRNKNGCSVLTEKYSVDQLTLGELREEFIGKADDALDRAVIPTLSDALGLSKRLGITPMIHPKNHESESVALIMEICDKTVGERNYYIVSENDACDYALSHGHGHCMVIASDRTCIERYAEFPDVIIAIRRGAGYNELVSFAHEKGHPVETTLNDEIRADQPADVINYDYRSPGRFDMYTDISSVRFADRNLAAVESFEFSGNSIRFGTVGAAFRMLGRAKIRICGHEFAVDAEKMTAIDAAVLAYNSDAAISIRALSDMKIEALEIRTGKHDIERG